MMDRDNGKWERNMGRLTLVIGNRVFSSWSLRPWFAMTMVGLPFEEIVIPLDKSDTKRQIAEHTKAGRVPVLYHGKIKIWDSLAILEYLAETFPEKKLWPQGQSARAVARAVSNEMHSGFSALRSECAMNLRRPRMPTQMSDAAQADVSRIETIWQDCREKYGKSGKYLFGRFSIADAMFAPVATRFDTYALPVGDVARAYIKTILDSKTFRSWKDAALQETWDLPRTEVA
jgi:glutathione S-transferase